MNATASPTTTATRQPMTTLGKVIFGISLFLALGSFVGGVFTGSIALYVTGTADLVLAVLIATGLRWAPIPGAVISAIGLIYALFVNPYPQAHLSDAKDPLFAPIVIVMGLAILTTAAMIAAIAQNYWEPARQTPRWFSFVLTGVIGAMIGAILIGAIAQPAAATNIASDGATIVHLTSTSFGTKAIALPVGGKLQFVADSSVTHILTYGDWNGTKTQLATPANAPALDNRQISGGSFEIGPFTTAGTYHILCTIHPGMEITIIVA